MKIKTKLQITTVVSLIVALVIGSILFFSAQQVNKAIEKDMAADEIIKGLFELNILTNEYLIHHEERAKTQWQLRHDSIKRLLEEIKVKSPEKVVLLRRMRENHESIKTTFSQMVLNYESYRDGKSGVSQELNEMLAGNLDVKSRYMVYDAYQLAQISSARVSTSQQRAYFLVVWFTLIIAVVVVTVSFSIHRGVLKPIRKLHEGTEIIGAGNLNYKVGTIAKDEVGQLSRAFDRMTIQLKESFIGLEKEITEHKQAEEELNKYREHLEELVESRAAELKQSEERFRIAVESVSDLIWEWDIVKGDLTWFGKVDEMLGYEPGEFPRTLEAWEKVIHPDDQGRVMTILDQHLQTRKPYLEEYRVFKKDGSILYWFNSGTALWDEKGKAYKMIGAVSDITNRKRAEEALALQARIANIFLTIPDDEMYNEVLKA
ncbi:MAG: PAS domain S-box protein, partial [Deltaproteobacteria bacterium]|nr:PAS domain S-box protein [Deltaproteobacteria bacterium]